MRFDNAINKIQKSVEQSGFILAEDNLDLILELYYAYKDEKKLLKHLGAREKEYKKGEYLLNINSTGSLAHLPKHLSNKIKSELQTEASLKNWFKVSDIHPKAEILLPARWLCHITGLRHACAHLFIDLPGNKGYTLIQIRNYDKVDSPGKFDLPVGGHIKDVEGKKLSVSQEMQEEIGLKMDDIKTPVLCKGYRYEEPYDKKSFTRNVEYRYVYVSEIKKYRLETIDFTDKEVAAIAIFSIRDLKKLLKKFPERVGSALRCSFPKYLDYINK